MGRSGLAEEFGARAPSAVRVLTGIAWIWARKDCRSRRSAGCCGSGSASRVPPVPGSALMAATTASTSLAPAQPVFTDAEWLALGGIPGRVPRPYPRGILADTPR